MSTLKEAIAAFQSEIAAALGPIPAPSSGPSWALERVALDLAVTLIESKSGDPTGRPAIEVLVVSSGQRDAGPAELPEGEGRGPHRLTIEFSLQATAASGAARQNPIIGSTPLDAESTPARTVAVETVPREDSTRLLLTELLGPPGFYSSARAAVLSDALRDRTSEQARAVAAAINRPAKEVADEPVRHSRHLIRGIVQTGPLKSPERAEQLLSKLIEWWAIPELLQFIAIHWRPEDHW